jgi:aryl-alcohol dehydrogenase-like predicted oxidoreductase
MGMSKSATEAGTRRYAERFAGRAAEGHFRQAQGLALSSLGIGTYLGNPDARTDTAYTEAVAEAVKSGVNVIDSAINYRFQRSERSIGAALKQLFAEGFAREELVLCTKGGFLTPDGDVPADPRAYFEREYFSRGVMKREEVAGWVHCMSASYLENQLQRSLRNLGVDCIDVYYIHNPETQFVAVTREEFRARVRAAFTFLESAVAAGSIRFYGMATWNAFRVPESERDHISAEEMAGIAREAGGAEHHFRFVQLPFNLRMPEAMMRPSQPLAGHRVPMNRAAEELGITLVASASLMQGEAAHDQPDFVREIFGLSSDLHRALQFARSAPGIATALVGMSRAAHVRQNLELIRVPPTPLEQFLKLFDH